jgi:large subunit ribosomal protein L32
MPPLPKKKHSKKRKGGRNAHNGMTPLTLSVCSTAGCDSRVIPHRACPKCGFYAGREVVQKETN